MVKVKSVELILAALLGFACALPPQISKRFEDASSPAASPVTYDKYGISINGQRIFHHSAELHYWRLPSPALWRDVLQKYKAAGLTAASIYYDWGYHSPKSGEYDFTGVRDIDLFNQIAKEVGIYLVSRSGPYINAETTGGGFPGWVVTSQGKLRSIASDYTAHWMQWLTAVDPYLVKHQITKGGAIILNQVENEYTSGLTNTSGQYMAALAKKFRDDGLTGIPFTFNDANEAGHFINGTGAVNIYGYDAYPQGFDCSKPTVWGQLPTSFRDVHNQQNPNGPNFIPEFQGGAFDPWGGVGYDKCQQYTNDEFEKVFYKNNFAQGVSMVSYYMGYGGTSWGGLPEPTVYTAYGYGSSIQESRQLTTKYDELKRQGFFLRTFKDFAMTDLAGSGTTYTSDSSIFTTVLSNPETKSSFYIVRHNDGTSTSKNSFSLSINSAYAGNVSIPRMAGTSITLDGRDSKLLVVDYKISNSTTMAYSTTDAMVNAQIGGRDVVILYGPNGQDGEASFTFSYRPKVKVSTGSATFNVTGNTVTFTFKTTGDNIVTVYGGSGLLLYLLQEEEAAKFWAPTVGSNGFDFNDFILAKGPYVVRNATVTGSTANLVGDTNGTTTLEVAGTNVKSVTWNGQQVKTKTTAWGTLVGTVGGAPVAITLPALSNWKYSAASPETASSFDDSKWVVANHENTTNPTKPNTTYVLYADDYGYHTGNLWWRGRFNSSATSISLTVQGGLASGWTAWLNGNFLGTASANGSVASSSANFTLTPIKGSNVLSILQDHMGLSENFASADEAKEPRGILQAKLNNGDFSEWRVQGNQGGEDIVDKTRGPYNVGGLYAERSGFTAPKFDDSKWVTRSPSQGFNSSGVAFYRTHFTLNIPKGLDAPIGLQFPDAIGSKNYRAQIYINGWNFGKYVNKLGPQSLYYLPEGILNHQCDNVLGLSVWSLDTQSSQIGVPSLYSYGAYESGYGSVATVYSP